MPEQPTFLYGAVLALASITLDNLILAVAAVFLLAAGIGLYVVNLRLNNLEHAGKALSDRLEAIEERVSLHPDG